MPKKASVAPTDHSHAHSHAPAAGALSAKAVLNLVEQRIDAAQERMTDVRRDVVMTLAGLSEPHSAYQILAMVNRRRDKPLSAMSLYRTLDFLIRLGSVVKIDSLNAFKLCVDGGEDHSHLLIVCDACGSARDIDDEAAATALHAIARKHGHQLQHHVVELHGMCEGCVG